MAHGMPRLALVMRESALPTRLYFCCAPLYATRCLRDISCLRDIDLAL